MEEAQVSRNYTRSGFATIAIPEWRRARNPELPATIGVNYELVLDEDGLLDLVYRATLNKAKKAQDGPLTVTVTQVKEGK